MFRKLCRDSSGSSNDNFILLKANPDCINYDLLILEYYCCCHDLSFAWFKPVSKSIKLRFIHNFLSLIRLRCHSLTQIFIFILRLGIRILALFLHGCFFHLLIKRVVLVLAIIINKIQIPSLFLYLHFLRITLLATTISLSVFVLCEGKSFSFAVVEKILLVWLDLYARSQLWLLDWFRWRDLDWGLWFFLF